MHSTDVAKLIGPLGMESAEVSMSSTIFLDSSHFCYLMIPKCNIAPHALSFYFYHNSVRDCGSLIRKYLQKFTEVYCRSDLSIHSGCVKKLHDCFLITPSLTQRHTEFPVSSLMIIVDGMIQVQNISVLELGDTEMKQQLIVVNQERTDCLPRG